MFKKRGRKKKNKGEQEGKRQRMNLIFSVAMVLIYSTKEMISLQQRSKIRVLVVGGKSHGSSVEGVELSLDGLVKKLEDKNRRFRSGVFQARFGRRGWIDWIQRTCHYRYTSSSSASF